MQWSVLEVHHIERAADGGTDEPENILIICANCHRIAHFMFPQRGAGCPAPSRSQLLDALRDPVGSLMHRKKAAVEALRGSHMPEPPSPKQFLPQPAEPLPPPRGASRWRDEQRERDRQRVLAYRANLKAENERLRAEKEQLRAQMREDALTKARIRTLQQQAANARAEAQHIRQKEREFWAYAKNLRKGPSHAVSVPIRDRLA